MTDSSVEKAEREPDVKMCGKHIVVFFAGDNCDICRLQAGRASLEEERLPKIPDPALIDSMSMRYNHGFGLLSANQQEGIRRTMRQLYEEVAGYGFYHPGYKLPVHKGENNGR